MPQFLSAMLVRVKHPILIGGQSCTLVSMCSKKLKSWKSYLFQPSSLDKSCEITTTSGEPDVRHCSATSSNLKFIYVNYERFTKITRNHPLWIWQTKIPVPIWNKSTLKSLINEHARLSFLDFFPPYSKFYVTN